MNNKNRPFKHVTAAILLCLNCALLFNTSALAFNTGDLQSVVDEAYDKFKDLKDGENANYIPELAKVPSELFGIAIVTADGKLYTAGDADYSFSIQSVAKPFTAALLMEENSVAELREKIGVEPTGMPFNSIMAIQLNENRTINPMVNAGAIATVSLIAADNANQRWDKILNWYSALAGEPLRLMDTVYKSESETNYNNRAIANMLYNYERLYSAPAEAVDVYTKECSVGVTAKQLAVMGATIANHGKNPVTGLQLMSPDNIPELLAIMFMAGFYDEVGHWAYSAALPAKTGVGGGIVAIVPGKMSIVAFSPRLNQAGNSVRAMKAIEYISRSRGLGLFGPNPL